MGWANFCIAMNCKQTFQKEKDSMAQNKPGFYRWKTFTNDRDVKDNYEL